jgi:hypothetical protein
MSPDELKYDQDGWSRVIHGYEYGSLLYFIGLAIVLMYISGTARKSKNAEQRKNLYLARKIILYVGILGWVLFTGAISGLIHI